MERISPANPLERTFALAKFAMPGIVVYMGPANAAIFAFQMRLVCRLN